MTTGGRRSTRAEPRSTRLLLVHSSAELYGSDRALLETVRALRSRGCSTLVVVPRPGPLITELEQCGAQVRVVPTVVLRKADMSPAGLLRVTLTAARVLPVNAMVLRRSRAQLLYVNTVTLPLWLPLARLLGVPAVCHVHEAEEGLRRPVALAMTLPLLLARRVLVNSRSARDLLLRTCPALATRAVLLYNGVPGPPRGPVDLGDGPGTPVRLVLVGRLSPRKGTDVAVSAVQELRRRGMPVALELVGGPAPGMEHYESAVRGQVAAAGLVDDVSFAGFLEDVWDRLAAADLVLVPSRVEPFGNVAVEAALARRPVVASRVQGLQEVVCDGRTGRLVPPDDPVALADAVASLVTDWPSTRHMAEVAEQEAQRRFGVQRYSDELLSLLAAALR